MSNLTVAIFSASNTVLVVFRIVNFLVLAVLIVYAIKKYVLPMLREQIDRQKNFFVSLHRQVSQAKEINTLVDREINEQCNQVALLLAKIKTWSDKIKLQEDLQQNIYMKRDKQIVLQRKKQLNSYFLYSARKKIVPLAIQKASCQLTEKYSDQAQQQKYINNVVAFMRKKSL
jgi:F0F1-type ATP synthase membrane subunit b/b'